MKNRIDILPSEKPIYVLFVHHGYGYAGGAPVSLLHLILELKQTGRLTMKIVCHDDVVRNFFAERAKIPVGIFEDPLTHVGKILTGWATLESWGSLRSFILSLFAFPGSVLRQFRFFRAETPDIVHLNSATLFSSAIAVRLACIPVVWHVREVFPGGKFCLRRRFTGWLLRILATKVIAISHAEASSLGGMGSPKVKVVSNPYDVKLLNPDRYDQVAEKKRLGYSEKTKIILSLGGVSPRKGTVELIEAMLEQDSDTVLLFAGPPLNWPSFILTKQSLKHLRHSELPENVVKALKPLKYQGFFAESEFLEIVEKHIGNERTIRYQRQIVKHTLNIPCKRVRNILTIESLLVKIRLKKSFSWHYPQRVKLTLDRLQRDCVRFVGKVKNVAPLLAACDVLAFAGTLPHFPRPVCEAGLMRKPVVVFDMPGVTENVEDGITGIVVKERSGIALGQALRELLSDSHKIVNMGEAGYKRAKSLPNKTQIASSVLSIYEEITLAASGRQVDI